MFLGLSIPEEDHSPRSCLPTSKEEQREGAASFPLIDSWRVHSLTLSLHFKDLLGEGGFPVGNCWIFSVFTITFVLSILSSDAKIVFLSHSNMYIELDKSYRRSCTVLV